MTSLVAGLDLGTSSAKLVVLDTEGRLVAEASHSYPTTTTAGGVSEQDPDLWWDATRAALRDCGVADRIGVLGLTGQMQDLVPVRDGRPLRAALLYSDTRASDQHRRLTRAVPDWEVRTGNHQDVSNVAAKIAWLAELEPDVLAGADHLLLSPAGAVAHRAGAVAACDVLTASTTGLLDLTTRTWAGDVLAAAGVDPALMPVLTGTDGGHDVVGAVSDAAATELGLPTGTPLVLAMGDAGSTTAGLVGDAPGDAYLYLGTTGWLAAVTPPGDGSPSPIHSLVMPGWDARLRIGAVASAGASAAWALATYLPGATFADAEARVAGFLDRVVERPLCLPGLSGERTPVRDGVLRGAFVGLHETTRPEDLYLAVLTGVAMNLRHAGDDMGIVQDRIALVGGASGSAVWRQVLADVFGTTVVTTRADDPGARHAARAAATALGWTHSIRPVFEGSPHTTTHPSDVHRQYQPMVELHRGLYDALTPTFHRLADHRTGSTRSKDEHP